MVKKYTFLEHTSELKIKLFGKNIEELFENCALAFSEIVGRGQPIKDTKKHTISLEMGERERSLYQFIEEMIYLLDAEHFIVSRAEVTMQSGNMRVVFHGDSAEKYNDLDHVKAATYSEMYIREVSKGNWEAQVVVDV